MSLDEFIERFLLSRQEVPKTYESIYDMGNTQELVAEQCEDISVAREVIIQHTLISQEDLDAEAEEYVQKLYRKGGLLDRLIKYLQFDLEAFDKNNECYKRERCKILYFFYMLEHVYFEKYNVLKLLSRPSMENIDNASLGMETRNGFIISTIKSCLEKELSLTAKAQIKGKVEEIAEKWDSILDNAHILMDFMYEKGCEYDYESTIQCLESGLEDKKIPSISYDDAFTPIESLYLKIVRNFILI